MRAASEPKKCICIVYSIGNMTKKTLILIIRKMLPLRPSGTIVGTAAAKGSWIVPLGQNVSLFNHLV